MPPRKRPTAFEVSFGDSDNGGEAALSREASVEANSLYRGHSQHNMHASTSRSSPMQSQATLPSGSSSRKPPSSRASSVTVFEPPPTSFSPSKRKADSGGLNQLGKRLRLDDAVHLLDPSLLKGCLRETEDTVIVGEEEPGDDSDNKPIRLLTDFTIFDPEHNNALVSLAELEEPEADNRHFEMVGHVGPVYANEEDAGQDCEAELDELRPGLHTTHLQRLRTSAIVLFSIDYKEKKGPIYVKTEFAFYTLSSPSQIYSTIFKAFYAPHRAAQLLISTAFQDPPSCTEVSFFAEYEGMYDEMLCSRITRRLLKQAYPIITAVMQSPGYQTARRSPFLQAIISQNHATSSLRTSVPSPPTPITGIHSPGNIDLLVLRPENQNQTVVTPRIAGLAQGLFRESLHVLGSKVPLSSEHHSSARKMLDRWLRQWLKTGRQVEFEPGRSTHCRRVRVNHCEYQVGDVVAVPAASYKGREYPLLPQSEADLAQVPEHHTAADYFWFGRIQYINRQDGTAHVQWFEHASKTLLQEIHDPNELFATMTCGSIELSMILKKCVCTFVKTRGKNFKSPVVKSCWRSMEFYYSYIYNQEEGTFVQADEHTTFPLPGNPPDNCANCARAAAEEMSQAPQIIEKGCGVAIGGYNYHLSDYALAESLGGPCHVVQVIDIETSSKARDLGACKILVKVFGRVRDMGTPEDGDMYWDEQELFLTNQMERIDSTQLLKPCRVKAASSFSPEELQTYIDSSPLHFYVRFLCDRADRFFWQRKTAIGPTALTVCAMCHARDQATARAQVDFKKLSPLRAFDPFAGTGAFALSMQETGILKLTHAVEISPSAAKTLKKNSPDTLVYNQCANEVLKSAVKKADSIGELTQLLSIERQPLPDIIKPGDIDCIVAGFPCQPHSTLNMYQRANDRKSHLILTLLSWIDFLRPKHCFFENVRGFIQYNLNATQHGRYKVQGGIKAGGLKFLVCALLAMGYQVRFSLLQAAHYGTPQSRVRFFLIASRLGCTLPSLPAPLYDFTNDSLAIKFPHGLTVTPITPTSGLVPFRYISVQDAISDLPWFDWRNPLNPGERPREVRGEAIPLKECTQQKPTCGISQPGYRFPKPRTRYQAKARIREEAVKNLQHYTRPLKKDTVARVTYIKMAPGADFRSLFEPHVPRSLLIKEWQLTNPSSAVARRGFKDSFYGRLDASKWFHTTVTNVEPMAKQSWVLNPWCKRVLTVRELARSQGFPDDFEFCSVNDIDVKTMHREIGNAVPWPVGIALGRELWEAEFKDWVEKRANAVVIE